MYFGFNEQQRMLRSSVQRFLAQHCPIKEVRRIKACPEGYAEDHWQALAAQGWLGAGMPEAAGGLGLSSLDLVVILEEFGRGLFPSPFISQVLAIWAVAENGSRLQKQAILPALVSGSKKATLALFEHGNSLRTEDIQCQAIEAPGGFVLSGSKLNVMDLESADLFIVSATMGKQPALFLVEANQPGVKAVAYPLIDQTKRMGTLLCDAVEIPESNLLCTGASRAIERLLSQGALLLTAEASGAMGATLDQTVAYAKRRVQFGHPIGHFQAVKHPLAEIYVDLESFRSLLYYAALSNDKAITEKNHVELQRIASLAKAYATDCFIRGATDAIQIHGATGYMVEVDVHLYYLRALWFRPLFGDSVAHYEKAFSLKQRAIELGSSGFEIDMELTAQEEAFRQEVRDFLKSNNTPPEQRTAETFRSWLKAVRDKRYIGFSWPEACGGRDGGVMEQFILKEEMLNAKAEMLGTDFTGLGWVGPAVIQFGTEEQKKRILSPILESKTVWCTGYSEPEVGSDLASLACKAVLNSEGTHYIVNGQKIWTSLAHMGTGIYCLVRTGNIGNLTADNKHEGISCLLIPLDSPGIEVRPIESFAGDHFAHLYNEVFFTDVAVPIENRIGQEGDGWAIICGALQNERSGIAEVNRHHKAMERLIKLAGESVSNGLPALESSELRIRLSRFDAQIEAARLNGLRALSKQVNNEAHDSEASLNKLHNCHLLVEMSNTAMELLAEASPYVGDCEANIGHGKWQIAALGWPTTVIGGGTANIQKNIIAERILGLPKD
jgi:alkylation response protein AidB-like acyl-CoA dehydrogenase